MKITKGQKIIMKMKKALEAAVRRTDTAKNTVKTHEEQNRKKGKKLMG